MKTEEEYSYAINSKKYMVIGIVANIKTHMTIANNAVPWCSIFRLEFAGNILCNLDFLVAKSEFDDLELEHQTYLYLAATQIYADPPDRRHSNASEQFV